MKAIDLFAGFGGFTLAAQQAGADVVWAANHNPVAVAVHSANHPKTEHTCQDLRQADWTSLPRFDLLLASPACQGHSTCSQPKRRAYHDAMRATAWAVVDCADVTEPRAVVIENVTSFRNWRLYTLLLEAFARIGYRMTEHIITATAFGVPQRRERLFLVGLRNDRRFALPLNLSAEPSFDRCIDPNAEGWRPVSSAKPGARKRIHAAQSRLGHRCLVQHVTGHRGVPLHEPIRTITTKDHWVIADGSQYRPLTTREYARGMGFPDDYHWPDDLARKTVICGLGNAVCPPVGRGIVEAVMSAA